MVHISQNSIVGCGKYNSDVDTVQGCKYWCTLGILLAISLFGIDLLYIKFQVQPSSKFDNNPSENVNKPAKNVNDVALIFIVAITKIIKTTNLLQS